MFFLAACIIGAGIAVLVYQLGLFDRPPFLYYDSLLGNESDVVSDDQRQNKKDRYLYGIVALSSKKNIGSAIKFIFTSIDDGMKECTKNAEELMQAAGKLYNGSTPTSENATNESSATEQSVLAIGLYFNNPSTAQVPKWAAGWAIEAESFEVVQDIAKQIQECLDKKETSEVGESEPLQIRAVRMGGPKCAILKGQIPSHNRFTPMLAPMIQWTRAFKTYTQAKYTANTGRPMNEHDEGPIALEVYSMAGNKICEGHIDYVVLFGDVKATWDDLFPLPDSHLSTKE